MSREHVQFLTALKGRRQSSGILSLRSEEAVYLFDMASTQQQTLGAIESLSQQLDSPELRAILRAHQRACHNLNRGTDR